MPLVCEVRNQNGDWIEYSQLIPGDPPASLSHWNAFGGREIYLLVCETDDSMSGILQSVGGLDTEKPGSVRIVDSDAFEIIREIHDGETYERTFFTDKSLAPRLMRFRHRTIRFGSRTCRICGQDFPAPVVGRHILEHPADELLKWPGGLPKLMEFYRASIKTSISRAEGFPRIQEKLRTSLKLVEDIQRREAADLN